jgi:hypothetical protein
MVSLPATADKGKGVATVGVTDRSQSLGNVAKRLIPTDADKTTIRLALERMGQPVGVVLVVVETRSLVAQVALGTWMRRIATYLLQMAIDNVDLQAAVTGTQDASCFGGCHGALSAGYVVALIYVMRHIPKNDTPAMLCDILHL